MNGTTCKTCKHYTLTGIKKVLGRCDWLKHMQEECGPLFVVPAWMGESCIVHPDRTWCKAWEEK